MGGAGRLTCRPDELRARRHARQRHAARGSPLLADSLCCGGGGLARNRSRLGGITSGGSAGGGSS
jgi:hypothetical protein